MQFFILLLCLSQSIDAF